MKRLGFISLFILSFVAVQLWIARVNVLTLTELSAHYDEEGDGAESVIGALDKTLPRTLYDDQYFAAILPVPGVDLLEETNSVRVISPLFASKCNAFIHAAGKIVSKPHSNFLSFQNHIIPQRSVDYYVFALRKIVI